MTTDIDNLEITELEELTKRAKVLIEKKQREKVNAAYNQVLEIAAEVGMSLNELIEYGAQRQHITEKRTVAPRYANPADKTQTWTGRGKQPRWVVEILAKGKTLESLLIN